MLTPKTSGEALVNDVVEVVADTGLFPEDHCFLRRIALVESKFGSDKKTYREGYFGGIWQVLVTT